MKRIVRTLIYIPLVTLMFSALSFAGIFKVATYPLRHPVKVIKVLTYPVRHPLKSVK
jgi:hypothetical protein